EDGIRDGHVTGVQTCALPISAFADCRWPLLLGSLLDGRGEIGDGLRTLWGPASTAGVALLDGHPLPGFAVMHDGGRLLVRGPTRSEERRVGKGGRAGAGVDQE